MFLFVVVVVCYYLILAILYAPEGDTFDEQNSLLHFALIHCFDCVKFYDSLLFRQWKIVCGAVCR